MRLRSLDVFRGLTMAAMVVVNNPGDWNHIYAPLLHAPWHGWTPTDLIFPFFLFIVGAAIAVGEVRPRSWAVVLRRTLVLIGLGLFLAGFPFVAVDRWRAPGVLQRIALCYFLAVAIVRFARTPDAARERRRIAIVSGVLLAAYWLALTVVPVPGGTAGDLTPAGNLGAWIDRTLFGRHLWRADWDPEGLLGTLPATGTTLLGVLAGRWLMEAASPRRAVRGLAVWGLAGVVAGLAWSVVFPINKALWTSSYVLFTGGLASACLAACFWWTDINPTPLTMRLTEPLVALGRNAILLFVLSGLLVKTLMVVRWPAEAPLGSWIYETLFAPAASPQNASLLYALANLAALWALLLWMHRRRLYISV